MSSYSSGSQRFRIEFPVISAEEYASLENEPLLRRSRVRSGEEDLSSASRKRTAFCIVLGSLVLVAVALLSWWIVEGTSSSSSNDAAALSNLSTSDLTHLNL